MSVLKQKGVYAIVYTNAPHAARTSHVYAVIKICYGTDNDSISVVYTKMGADQMGFQLPSVSVAVNERIEKLPVVSGALWKDLVKMAEIAMIRIKEEYKSVPAGKIFKIYRGPHEESLIEELK